MPRRAFNVLTEMEEDGPKVRPTLKSLAPMLNDSGFFDNAEEVVGRLPDAPLSFLLTHLPHEQKKLLSSLIQRNLKIYLTLETQCIGFIPDLSVLINKLFYSIPCIRLRFLSATVKENKSWQHLSPNDLANRLLHLLLIQA